MTTGSSGGGGGGSKKSLTYSDINKEEGGQEPF